MTAVPKVETIMTFTICCDAPGCGATYTGQRGERSAAVRQDAEEAQGWAYIRETYEEKGWNHAAWAETSAIRGRRVDLCPVHAPPRVGAALSIRDRIREVLSSYPDGVTVQELAAALGVKRTAIDAFLREHSQPWRPLPYRCVRVEKDARGRCRYFPVVASADS